MVSIIQQVLIRTGSEVDYVRVQYGGTWASGHGGSGGSPHIFEINPKAKIVIVQGRSGSRYIPHKLQLKNMTAPAYEASRELTET